MKLTDFKGNEAVEVLADVMEPVSVIVSDKEFQTLIKTKGTPIMKVVSYILKNFSNEVLDMYEPLTKEKREEATPTKLIQLILDISNDPELSSLFTSQGQQEALTPSGSATENTEDGLK